MAQITSNDKLKPQESSKSLPSKSEGKKPSNADKPEINRPAPRSDSSLQSIRELVGQPFVNLLRRLKWKSLKETNSLQQQIATDYAVWAESYNFIHEQFSQLWDFLNLIENEGENWFRVAPKGTKTFIDINNEGYSFSAGVEQNYSRGTPMPKKWIIVNLAHSDHWTFGFGDERCLGRPEPIDDHLVGLKKCNIRDLEKAAVAAKELRRRAEETPLVFQMYSEKIGQRGVKVPLHILSEHSLIKLCKGLFVALNKDVLEEFLPKLPAGVKLESLS